MDTQLLADLIEQKHHLLTQIHALALRQVEYVDAGDTGKLLGLLAAKQSLLQNLQGLERQLDPFRHQDPDRRSWRSLQQRRTTHDLAARCESLLQQIMQIERHCEGHLMARRDAAAERLQQACTAVQAAQAYAQPSTLSGQFDVSSEI